MPLSNGLTGGGGGAPAGAEVHGSAAPAARGGGPCAGAGAEKKSTAGTTGADGAAGWWQGLAECLGAKADVHGWSTTAWEEGWVLLRKGMAKERKENR